MDPPAIHLFREYRGYHRPFLKNPLTLFLLPFLNPVMSMSFLNSHTDNPTVTAAKTAS
ncbi:MAG: hypothetical protein A4E31_01412 [Methanomassiliicoccales archaeon PtaU1.Bin030]|nr:MAG: hypothetical protein A4E31_01412 [Methanomassiliicoccales archaeon PtaU1.Bin030]